MELRSVGFTVLAIAAAFGAAVAGTYLGNLAVRLVGPTSQPSTVHIRGCEVSELVQRSEALFLDRMPEGSREEVLLHLDVSNPLGADKTERQERIVIFFSTTDGGTRGGGGPAIRFDPYLYDLVS